MPLAGAPSAAPTTLEGIVPLFHAPFHPLGVGVTEMVTLPGQVVLSLLLVLVAAWQLRKRGRMEAAVCWTAAWLVAVAVELVFRHTLTRPPLYPGRSAPRRVRLLLAERSRAALRARRGRTRRRLAAPPDPARDVARGRRRTARACRLPHAHRRRRRATPRDGGHCRRRRARAVRAASAWSSLSACAGGQLMPAWAWACEAASPSPCHRPASRASPAASRAPRSRACAAAARRPCR